MNKPIETINEMMIKIIIDEFIIKKKGKRGKGGREKRREKRREKDVH